MLSTKNDKRIERVLWELLSWKRRKEILFKSTQWKWGRSVRLARFVQRRLPHTMACFVKRLTLSLSLSLTARESMNALRPEKQMCSNTQFTQFTYWICSWASLSSACLVRTVLELVLVVSNQRKLALIYLHAIVEHEYIQLLSAHSMTVNLFFVRWAPSAPEIQSVDNVMKPTMMGKIRDDNC